MKSKEQISAYNKAYFARPEVIARAKIRNANRRAKRLIYKKTERGKLVELKYRRTERSKELQQRSRLKCRYGITPEDYDEILRRQKGRCAICFKQQKTKLHIDHCHNTNKIRGLLCGSCNRALGLMKDNVVFLKNAINYLYGN